MRRWEYLKHGGWKKINNGKAYADVIDGVYDDVDDIVPKKASMRSSAKYGNSCFIPHHRYSAYQSDKWDMYSQKISHFLSSRIGKSFNKVFSEFKEKFPEQFGNIHLPSEFKSRFLSLHELEKCNYSLGHFRTKHWAYYVDENGIIRNLYIELKKKDKPRKSKKVEINLRSINHFYRFNDNVFEDGRLYNIIESRLPGKYKYLLERGKEFSEFIYRDITNTLLGSWQFAAELAKLHSEDWYFEHYNYRFGQHKEDYNFELRDYRIKIPVLNTGHVENFIFSKRTVKDCDKLFAGSPKHLQYIQDNRKHHESIQRKNKKDRELEYDNLLHTIEESRKDTERQRMQDIIDRDRLGFDENSFFGEFYHGQKRKKK